MLGSTDQTSAPPVGRWPLAGLSFAGLFIGGLVLAAVLGTGTYPSPFGSADATAAYFADNTTAVRGQSLLHTLAVIPLLVFVGALAEQVPDPRPRRLVTSSGSVAAALLLFSALCGVALVFPGIPGESLTVLHVLAFLTGGVGHVVLLGVLVGAATAATARAVPLWLTGLGFLSAALCVASLSSVVLEAATVLLPLGRFTAIVWIIATALRLVLRRAA